MFIYLFISGALIVLGIILRKNNIVPCLQMIWIWLIMAFSNGGADYPGHLEIFVVAQFKHFSNIVDILSPDKLYVFLCKLAGRTGLDFYHFNMLCVSIGLAGLYYIVLKECNRPSVALSYYMLFPLVDSVIQKRFFLASIVILYALITLRNKGKLFWLKYVLLVIVSSGLHSSTIFYLILLPLDFVSYKALKKWVVIIVPSIILGLSAVPVLVSKLLGGSIKVYTYFVNRQMRLDSIYKVFVFVLVQVIFVLLHYMLFNDHDKDFDFYRKIDISMLTVTPLYYYNSVFLRFYRTILPLFYIKVSEKYTNNHKYELKEFILIVAYSAYIVWMFLFSYVLFGKIGFDVLVKGLFEYNGVFGNN